MIGRMMPRWTRPPQSARDAAVVRAAEDRSAPCEYRRKKAEQEDQEVPNVTKLAAQQTYSEANATASAIPESEIHTRTRTVCAGSATLTCA